MFRVRATNRAILPVLWRNPGPTSAPGAWRRSPGSGRRPPRSWWPRSATTGGKAKLLGIGKRGSKYLRKMLVHGARSALPHLARGGTGLGRWLAALRGRAHVNTAVVALANKLARIAWAVLRRGEVFDAGPAAAARA